MLSRYSSKRRSIGEQLYLNVYDLTPINGYMHWLGLGVYHSAIEAYGVEYGFGAHDFPSSGVFEVEPRCCPGFTFRKSISLGAVHLGPCEFREFIEQITCEYTGDSYHLIAKNCNHFCEDVCRRLTGFSIPGWVNRLAKLGSFCSCLLPGGVQTVRRRMRYELHEGGEEEDRDSRDVHREAATTSPIAVAKEKEVPRDWKSSYVFKESLRHSR